jgi:hypothetical protein
MPSATPSPSHSSSTSWGVALAATSVLIIGGGAIIWAHRESAVPSMDEATLVADGPSDALRPYPAPIVDEVFVSHSVGTVSRVSAGTRFHSVSYAVENGAQVVKIRVVPDGDELIVDAATGRLLETRPSRPTVPPPMGKLAAPFVPAT